ncbi:hypothetical protein [Yinghuangia soli]|uniref:Uncharacterized protein n=1 Tax=Yinghuangia soli TaxID=2908204 RepID=A0AA41Q1A9_9ACTN|nr:hypothetical protein [Yinghuangia soli]MCF2529729.1 hypothetical protein [Yinghuangia soli]
MPWAGLAATGVVGFYVAVFAWAMENRAYDMWGALIVFPLLLTLSIPLLERFTRDDDPWFQKIVVWALVAKLVACFARYWMSFVLYDGTADAATYDRIGRQLAVHFRDGDFTVDIGRKVIGTGFIMIVTGIVYSFVGQSILSGYLVYSWMGFWGLYLCWRAFTIAYPDGDRKRYAKLVFFLPSLLFWPSGIGKDTWMLLTLGMCAYGCALLLVRRRGAYFFLLLGMTGTTMVRPHVTVLIMCGLMVGYLLRSRPQQVSALGPLRAGFGAVVLGAAAVIALKQVGKFFGTADLSAGSATQVLNHTQTQTAQGGSASGAAVEQTSVISPSHLPQSLMTVLFRPFPFEVHNMQALLASLEGVLLMALVVTSLARLRKLPALLVRRPYLAFALVYTLVFAMAFANIKNFGILTRERVQVFPFVLVLLAISKPEVPDGQGTRRRRKGPVKAKAGGQGPSVPGAGPGVAAGSASGSPSAPGPVSGPAAGSLSVSGAWPSTPNSPGSATSPAGTGFPAAGRGEPQWR